MWKLEITQPWAIGAPSLTAIPILMVVLSTTLRARASRLTNLAVATIYVLVSVANAIGESWTTYFALAITLELGVLGLIMRTAWTWPRGPRSSNAFEAIGPVRTARAL